VRRLHKQKALHGQRVDHGHGCRAREEGMFVHGRCMGRGKGMGTGRGHGQFTGQCMGSPRGRGMGMGSSRVVHESKKARA
jgi:hypothetical protein